MNVLALSLPYQGIHMKVKRDMRARKGKIKLQWFFDVARGKWKIEIFIWCRRFVTRYDEKALRKLRALCWGFSRPKYGGRTSRCAPLKPDS